MGWSSGGDVFNSTARTLLAAGVQPDMVTKALAVLIDQLLDGDWDTCDESVQEFRNEPAVIAAFRIAAPEYVEHIPAPPVGTAPADWTEHHPAPPGAGVPDELLGKIADLLDYDSVHQIESDQRVIAEAAYQYGRGER